MKTESLSTQKSSTQPLSLSILNWQWQWNHFWFHFFLLAWCKAYTRLPSTNVSHSRWIQNSLNHTSFIIHHQTTQTYTVIIILQHITIVFYFYHTNNHKIMLQPISISKLKQGHQHHFGFSTHFAFSIQQNHTISSMNIYMHCGSSIQFFLRIQHNHSISSMNIYKNTRPIPYEYKQIWGKFDSISFLLLSIFPFSSSLGFSFFCWFLPTGSRPQLHPYLQLFNLHSSSPFALSCLRKEHATGVCLALFMKEKRGQEHAT